MASPRNRCYWPDGRGEGGSRGYPPPDGMPGSDVQADQKNLPVAVEWPSFGSSLECASISSSVSVRREAQRKGNPDASRIRRQAIRIL
jgi:hypothetical protein